MGRKARQKQMRVAVAPRDAADAIAPAPAIEWGKSEWTIVALLTALTLIVFGQVASHSFLNFDDGQFIYENQHVLNADVGWALTSAQIGWYPLTWLSHMLDVAVWGQRAGMHLLTGVVLHAASAIFLFLALRQMTRATWPPAFIAALFAIHPMHVESVAWASERKDTLSTLFAMIALWLYARAPRRMFGIAMAMALSLMAKQMYITLPFVFLLLDIWPQQRLRSMGELRDRVIEKWPLFALSIAGAIVAVIGQRNMHAMQAATALPIGDRVANALLSYAIYLEKLFWPVKMALPYPLTPVPLGEALVPLLLLAAISGGVAWAWRTAPYLATGWFWFLGTLVPVIGIVSIGQQSMADRYTYFSYVGLFIAITYGALDVARRLRIPSRALAVAAAIAVAACAMVAMRQAGYWRDSETLFAHTLSVTRDNSVAEYNLGQALQTTKPDEAMLHLRRAITLTEPVLKMPGSVPPDWYPQAYVAIGTATLTKARGMPESATRTFLVNDAIGNYKEALAIDPDAPHAKNNIAVAMKMLPRIKKEPLQADYDEYLNNGTAFSQAGRYDDAVDEFRHAVQIAPQSIEAHIYLGLGLVQAKHASDGVAELRAAKAIDAVQANEFLTTALHLPPSEGNLDAFIAQAAQ
jgi:tetratricopeptide (TPR) repeat protein